MNKINQKERRKLMSRNIENKGKIISKTKSGICGCCNQKL